MVEFIADRELLVKIEGIQMFVDYMSFITRLDVEKDFVPHLQEALEMLTNDDSADDEVEIRMIRMLGVTADRLVNLGILKSNNFSGEDNKLEKVFVDYFKSCINH